MFDTKAALLVHGENDGEDDCLPPSMSDEEIDRLTRDVMFDPRIRNDDDGAGLMDSRLPVEMAAVMSSASVFGLGSSCGGVDMVAVLRSRARMVAHHQALLLEAVADVVDHYETLDVDKADAHAGAAAEVSAVLVTARRTAASQVELAWRLRDQFPDVLAALRDGRIDVARTRVLVSETIHLDADIRQTVLNEVLPAASGLTVGQLRGLIRKLCIDANPEDAADRYRQALDDRAVTAELSEDHTGTIIAEGLPAGRVAVVMDRINRIAQSLRSTAETRTIDQLRADVFLDLLEGRHDSKLRGSLDIRVDLTTLAGLDDNAADLAGFGPVIADIARQVTGRLGPSWRIGVSDDTGILVHTGVTRRRPDAGTRRQVQMRDQTCVFPGCRRPATASDLDHRIQAADGGDTHPDQLVALCRHHHVIRHRFGWTHTREVDGEQTWRSPLGATHIRPPPRE